MLRSISEVTKL